MATPVQYAETARSGPAETPAQRRRREVRDSILSAAERVFAKEGEAGLSIRRLADEVEYSPGAIYKYFASKDVLIDELKDAFFDQLIESLQDVMKDPSPYPERSRRSIRCYIETALKRPHHYAAAFSGVTHRDTDQELQSGSEFANRSSGRAYGMLGGLIQEGVELGVLQQDLDIEGASKSLWASMHGLTMLMIHFPTFPDAFPGQTGMTAEAFIAFHADQVIRGIEAPCLASR